MTNTFQNLEKYIYSRETLGQQADADGRPTATDKDAWIHCCRRDVNAIQKAKCVSYKRRSCDTKFACHATLLLSEHSSDRVDAQHVAFTQSISTEVS